MFEHFIIMASSYFKGKRIAFQYAYEENMDYDETERAIKKIVDICGDRISFSTHYIRTEFESWESVVSYDPFFDDVYLAETLEEFIYLIRKDTTLSGLDIAKYILSKHKCTHLELEKLTYLCYADYLCKYGKRLCEDSIYAFTYGPVVDSIYGKYTRHKEVLSLDMMECIPYSRIMVLPDGVEKIRSIDETLEKYSKCSSTDLVNITHADNSPWRMKDSTKMYQIIDDDLIQNHHSYEEQYFQEHFQ